MKTLWYVPLELLDKRYTILMDKQLKKEFKENKIPFKTINGLTLTDKIKVGSFLDAESTNYFKMTQLQTIIKLFNEGKIKDNDVFFFSDLWFPGISVIPYITAFKKIKVKITGIMHAGSWTATDDVRTFMKKWAKYIEMGWFSFIDEIYVGSEFHKSEIIMRKRTTFPNKIKVTGLTFDSNEIYKMAKPLKWEDRDNIIVFPHRIHWEKQPEVYDKVMKSFKGKYKSYKTMEHNLPKKEYFKLLARSKFAFSSALQENFGYAMLECITLGCIPILPNRLSYMELYPECIKYNKLSEVKKIVEDIEKKKGKVKFNVKKIDNGVKRIVTHIRKKMLAK